LLDAVVVLDITAQKTNNKKNETVGVNWQVVEITCVFNCVSK
jgi:hypothetical protein